MERQRRRAPPFEPARCDYCRKSFGLILHRYYRMRFCSADCLKAYQGRLDDQTMARIQHIEVRRALPNCDCNTAALVGPNEKADVILGKPSFASTR